MLNQAPYYHGTIKKIITAFGTLFSGIFIERKQGDTVNGSTIQTLQIPIAYSCKEKYIVRLDSDPNQEDYTYTTLPRLAFEITDYRYDASRKTNKTGQITNSVTSSTKSTSFSPVPYDINISLYVLTKNQEDALQIIEQILPVFTPDYSLKVDIIPELNVVQNVPIILNDIAVSDEYEGDFQKRRFVIHTLSFTLKINLFGSVVTNGIITSVITSISNRIDVNNTVAVNHVDYHTNTNTITNIWTEDS